MSEHLHREAGPASEHRPLRLLLVQEDSREAAWTRQRIAETSVAAEVVHASSLTEGIFSLAAQPIDAVFVDLEMTAGSAADACRRMVELSGKPVIALTDQADFTRLQAALDAGIAGYYFKRRTANGIFRRKQKRSRGNRGGSAAGAASKRSASRSST